MSKELIERLRAGTTGDDGMTSELMAEAAAELERLLGVEFGAQKEASRCAELERELQRKESTINTISNALSFAESECSRYRARAGELENENRRLLLDLAEAKELL